MTADELLREVKDAISAMNNETWHELRGRWYVTVDISEDLSHAIEDYLDP
jgi:hypothetical protein